MRLTEFLIGLVFVIGISIIPFLIHPIIGVAWIIWLICVAVYTVKKNRRRK